MQSLPALKSLIFELSKLPGIGPVSAQRISRHLLNWKAEDVKKLSESLLQLKDKITKCSSCFAFAEERKLCSFCEDSSRNPHLLCVVEQPFDVFRVESCGAFRGYYHVLQGALSPLNHIHPGDLTFKELENRIKTQPIKELILAIDSDLEGDTTALYILENFKGMDLKISRLAQGIPFGSDLSFVDERTLQQAMENRSTF